MDHIYHSCQIVSDSDLQVSDIMIYNVLNMFGWLCECSCQTQTDVIFLFIIHADPATLLFQQPYKEVEQVVLNVSGIVC